MDMTSPTDYWCYIDSPEVDSFVESLLVVDEQISSPYADHWQSTQENESSGIGGVTSSTEDCYTTLQSKGSTLMQNQGELGGDALYQSDKEGDFDDSPCTDLMCLQEQESAISVEEGVKVDDSWNTVEEQMLRAAMADIFTQPIIQWQRIAEAMPSNTPSQPIIQWQRIAEALPSKTPSEVFNRTNQLLQNVLHDLSIFTTEQQLQHEQVGVMSPPEQQQKHQQQQKQIRRVRKMWSEEEHDKFLVGVERYGWGNWKKVATLIPSRTVPQVTSHAQKCLNHNKRIINNLLES